MWNPEFHIFFHTIVLVVIILTTAKIIFNITSLKTKVNETDLLAQFSHPKLSQFPHILEKLEENTSHTWRHFVKETEERTTLPSLGHTALGCFTGEVNSSLTSPSSVTLLITAWKGTRAAVQNLFPGLSHVNLGTFSCQQCARTQILAAEQPPKMDVCNEIEHFQLAQLNYIK